MDPRVYEVMQMLRQQVFTPLPGGSDAATGESYNKEEQEISLEKMALRFNLSESRMRALFKFHVGLSPTQYVIKLRIDRAAENLRDTYKRVTEIAVDFGFDSNSYFARSFKKVYGMTPTQYRNLHQQPSEGKEEEKNGASSSR
ncbi:MAG: helix-turn-helix domain-containing protein [Blastocatellia bacterium]